MPVVFSRCVAIPAAAGSARFVGLCGRCGVNPGRCREDE